MPEAVAGCPWTFLGPVRFQSQPEFSDIHIFLETEEKGKTVRGYQQFVAPRSCVMALRDDVVPWQTQKVAAGALFSRTFPKAGLELKWLQFPGTTMQRMSARDAKNNFGRLIDVARAEPVAVEKYGRAVVVVIAFEQFEKLTGKKSAKLPSSTADKPKPGNRR